MSMAVAEVVLTSREGVSSVEEMARNCKLDDEKLGKAIDDDIDERYEVDTMEFLGWGKGVVCGPANVLLNWILVGILVFCDADVAPCSIELLG